MKNCLLFVALLLSTACLAQTGYKIDFKITGLKDSTVYMGYYTGESTFVKDTARSNAQGAFTFDGKQSLPHGVYFLALNSNSANKTKIFDFVVTSQQHFTMETATEDFIGKMRVTGDEDNRLFFENMIYLSERHKEAEPLLKIVRDSTLKEDQKKVAREEFQKINEKVMARQDEIIAKHSTTLTAKILKLSRQIQIPPPPRKKDGTIDSTFALRYYREHFFDNLDLADDALTRLPKPFYIEKVNEYLDKLFMQTPDSLMAAIDGMAARAKKNQEAFKFLIWNCVYKYQRPEIMGLDEVYVRLVDKYFVTGAMDYWISESLKKTVVEHADKLRNSLIGKTGANLAMQDQNFMRRSLYDIRKKYTILYIFDPDCGHCREESPKLVSFYEAHKAKLDLEVFAVSADTSMKKMRDYIKEMKMTWVTVNGPRSYTGQYSKQYFAETTPSLYILDDKRKIIAKGLPVSQLETFFTNYEKYLQRKAAPKPKGT
jgi:thiol-disulfide isomerase/thioredoxin